MPPLVSIKPGGLGGVGSFTFSFMLLIIGVKLGNDEPLFFGAEVAVGFGVGVELPLCAPVVTLAFRLFSQNRNPKEDTKIIAMIPRTKMFLVLRLIRQFLDLAKPLFGSASRPDVEETFGNRKIEPFLISLTNFISSR
jgi:hypothetical protein